MDPETYNRRRNMVRALSQQNPDLQEAIAEVDAEGEAFYGQSYITGVDFMVETLGPNLLLEPATYHDLRQTMIHRASLAQTK
jgi:hypothetical protein